MYTGDEFYVRVCHEHRTPTTLCCAHLVGNDHAEIVAKCMNVFCHLCVYKRTIPPLMTDKQLKQNTLLCYNDHFAGFLEKSAIADVKSHYNYNGRLILFIDSRNVVSCNLLLW